MRGLIVALIASASIRVAQAEDCPDLATATLGDGLIEHSCFHTTNGPYATTTATPMLTAETPNLDPVHTLYTVAIDPARTNVVTYMPVRTGHWAIFGEADVPHVLLNAQGQAVPVERTHAVAACPAIPLVRVYTLTALERYTLQLGPSTRTTTPVVIEKVSDFEIPHGRDADGDGFGGAGDVVSTACVPPAGYVANVADCDDRDPDVHPEAAESCNGQDDNCNGVVDDGVCSVGGGGCASVSTSGGALTMLVLLTWLLFARRRR